MCVPVIDRTRGSGAPRLADPRARVRDGAGRARFCRRGARRESGERDSGFFSEHMRLVHTVGDAFVQGKCRELQVQV